MQSDQEEAGFKISLNRQMPRDISRIADGSCHENSRHVTTSPLLERVSNVKDGARRTAKQRVCNRRRRLIGFVN